uniref:Uncharacterized protein n=1 Tax=Anguilla anguilla TaxID=7936 RepID=A0A0E9PF07_ANGAN
MVLTRSSVATRSQHHCRRNALPWLGGRSLPQIDLHFERSL